MRRSTLRTLLRAHYRSASLPRDTVTGWIASGAAEVAGGRAGPRLWRRRRWTLVALSAAALVLLAWAGWHAWPSTQSTLAQAIATEVAANHAKSRPLDVEASTFAELRRAMDRFEFTLVEPQTPICANLTLVGARYCSIQGRPAAQIRLRDPRGEAFTLYEARDDTLLSGIPEAELVVDGSIVRLWRADGLFFALATAAH